MKQCAFKAPFRQTIFHFGRRWAAFVWQCIWYFRFHFVFFLFDFLLYLDQFISQPLPFLCLNLWFFYSSSFFLSILFPFYVLVSISFPCILLLQTRSRVSRFGQYLTSSVQYNYECYQIVKCAYIYLSICIQQVTGVVGRAETLSSVFFLLAFIFYVKSTLEKKNKLSGKYTLHNNINPHITTYLLSQ